MAALALTGSLINPAFAEALGWPQLAEGDGVAMIGLAAGMILVTAWEIVELFRRAPRSRWDPPASLGQRVCRD